MVALPKLNATLNDTKRLTIISRPDPRSRFDLTFPHCRKRGIKNAPINSLTNHTENAIENMKLVIPWVNANPDKIIPVIGLFSICKECWRESI